MENLILKLSEILEDYMNDVGGKIINYSDNQSLIMIPTKHNRYQKVLGWKRDSGEKNFSFIEFDSKICEITNNIDLRKYLEKADIFTFSRLIIRDGFLQIASSLLIDLATPELIMNMVKEVAEEADNLEFQITGKDIN